MNAHGGDLPRYRGNDCQTWAILNGEKKVGLCVHKMIGGGLDSGDIVARDYYALTQESTITKVHDWLSFRISELFKDPTYVLEKQSRSPEYALRCCSR